MKVDKLTVLILMAEQGLTQKAIAEKTGLARPTVSALINGKNCNPISIKVLADALGVSMREIIKEV